MLQKQAVDISFAKGLNTKTDPWRVPLGSFLRLKNSVFTTEGQLQSRYGFAPITTLPSPATYLTTFSGNLTAVGSVLQAYSSGNQTWVEKGAFQALSLSARPIARSALNQVQCDAVTASNGLTCVVFTEVDAGVSTYSYSVIDSVTGQNIVVPTLIVPSSGVVSGSPRVFVLGGYFIIVFTALISATSHLQYIAVSTGDPSVSTAALDIAASYVATDALSWDGASYENRLYIAYNTTSGGQSVRITYLTPSLGSPVAPKTYSGEIATIMSVTVDKTFPSQPVVYVSYYDAASNDGYTFAVDQNLNPRMDVTATIVNEDVYAITSAAESGLLTVVYELAAVYFYDTLFVSNAVRKLTVTLPSTVTGGTASATSLVLKSVGLASKAFQIDSVVYVLAEYASLYQPTYFLIDMDGNVLSKFGYQNGGASLNPANAYLPYGLPTAEVSGDTVSIAYLYKTLIEKTGATPASNGSGAPNIKNVYSQTGVNQARITFTADDLSSSEVAGNLNISGGILWNYDGETLAENGFSLFPDNVETQAPGDPTPTGDTTNGSPVLENISVMDYIVVGMRVTGAGIPVNSFVTAVDLGASEVTINQGATATAAGVTLTFTGEVTAQQYYYQVTYEWTDAAGNIVRSAPSIPVTITPGAGQSFVRLFIPTLKLTQKEGVKIVVYRWSLAQQTYYRATSLSSPLLNDPALDYVIFTDLNSDAQILGNGILYTTGGVLENTGGPASLDVALFDNRLWVITAEDRNVLAFSKQVIQAVPVEMSDLLTMYVAPSTGSEGSTGEMECIFPMDDKLIIFKQNAIYYINGAGPDNTGANSGYSQPIFITSSVGCDNRRSIVLTPAGLMFQSNKGIWLLGRGLETTYIGAAVEAYNDLRVNSAESIPGTTQVRFTLPGDTILMYDYYYDQWGTFEGAGAISSVLYEGRHTLLDSYGRVAQETPGTYLDNGNPVLLGFTTSWINVAGLQGYQRAYFFYLLGKFLSPHKLQITIAYDYNPSPTQSTLISPTNYAGNYGDSSPYGQENPYGGEGAVENWRVFLARQRCMAFQISLDEVFDSTAGVPAGAGLTLSGLNLVVGIKKGFRPIAAAQSASGGKNSG